jgi:uncharacterized protein (DUF1499 family)
LRVDGFSMGLSVAQCMPVKIHIIIGDGRKKSCIIGTSNCLPMNIRIRRRLLSSLILSVTFFVGCSGVRPVNLGVKDGKLLPCPSSLNCVSSQSSDNEHFIAPLRYTSSTADAMADLKKIILQMKRTAIDSETGNYLHVEFTSALWRFVDDVEFWFDESAHVIHVRSASRVGHSDLGVNRKRIEEIRAKWNARMKSLVMSGDHASSRHCTAGPPGLFEFR